MGDTGLVRTGEEGAKMIEKLSPKCRVSAYMLATERAQIVKAAEDNGFSVAAFTRYLVKIGYREFQDNPVKVFEVMRK